MHVPSTIREHKVANRIEFTMAPANRVEALAWVLFAHRCVVCTPHRDIVCLARSFEDAPVLDDTLWMVWGWCSGGPLIDVYDQVSEAARALGPFQPRMTGRRAAYWSVAEVFQAAWATEQGELSEVVGYATMAAYLARRAASEYGVTSESIRYQDRLFQTMFAQSRSMMGASLLRAFS
jgi:hypothetical protein